MNNPFAITLGVGTSRANHTGRLAYRATGLRDLDPPCAAGCPAGENVREWLRDAEDGGAATNAPGGGSWRPTRSRP